MSDTKRIAAVVILLGLSTCFLPLLSISPPALGKSDWSAWDILRLIASGPNPGKWTILGAINLWVIYGALAGSLLLLWLPHYLTTISVCAMASFTFIGLMLRYHSTYANGFSLMLERLAGWHRGTVIINPEAYVLPALLIFLLYVVLMELKIPSTAR
jgi:hypothetical protein